MLGGGLDQHGLRRRTRMAQVREEVAERARAVGVLVAETSFVTPGLGDLDLGPIRLELVGDDEGDGGAHALAHLRAMAGDGDGAVRRDGHEHLRVVLPAMRHGIGAEFLRLVLLVLGTRGITPGQGEHQGAHAAEHGAAADIGESAGRFGGGGRLGGEVGHDLCVVNHRRSPLLAAGAFPAA